MNAAITWTSILSIIFSIGCFGQKASIDLTFTARKQGAYVKLDSIKVMNRTQTGQNMIYWPDTTLTIEINPDDLLLFIGYATFYPVGVQEKKPENSLFQLFQNHPNPVKDQTLITMNIPAHGSVNLKVMDMQGRVVIGKNHQMSKGIHSFRFSPGNASLYLLAAQWNGIVNSIKIINAEPGTGKKCRLEYFGNESKEFPIKESLLINNLESGILDNPKEDETYFFQFATNIPCPGITNFTYEGQVYNTIQIFNQCWLKENLNVGVMINGDQEQTNNGIKEKHCYNNDPVNCTIYGGLYQWDEMMLYTAQQGTQGICPAGWHLPTDEEWKVLEGAADSLFGIGDIEWDIFLSLRGYDAGKNLKAKSNWAVNGNGADLFGFSGLPGGYRGGYNYFDYLDVYGYWWTSTEIYDILAWDHTLDNISSEVFRAQDYQGVSFSVRCLRNK